MFTVVCSTVLINISISKMQNVFVKINDEIINPLICVHYILCVHISDYLKKHQINNRGG